MERTVLGRMRREIMKPELREKRCRQAAFLGFLWSGSGFAAAIYSVNYGLKDPGGVMGWAAYGVMVIYMGALLYFDALLFRVRSPGANRLMLRYWGFSTLGLTLWLLGGRPVWNAEQGGALVMLLLLCAFTPFSAVLPLGRACVSDGGWSTMIMTNTMIALLLSLAQLLLFSLLQKRENRVV